MFDRSHSLFIVCFILQILKYFQLEKKMPNKKFQFSSFEINQDELNKLKIIITRLGASYDESKV